MQPLHLRFAVCGLRDGKLQEQLSSKNIKTLAEAVRISKEFEKNTNTLLAMRNLNGDNESRICTQSSVQVNAPAVNMRRLRLNMTQDLQPLRNKCISCTRWCPLLRHQRREGLWGNRRGFPDATDVENRDISGVSAPIARASACLRTSNALDVVAGDMSGGTVPSLRRGAQLDTPKRTETVLVFHLACVADSMVIGWWNANTIRAVCPPVRGLGQTFSIPSNIKPHIRKTSTGRNRGAGPGPF